MVHIAQPVYDQVTKTWLKDLCRTTESDQDSTFGSSDKNDKTDERLSNFFDKYDDSKLATNIFQAPKNNQV